MRTRHRKNNKKIAPLPRTLQQDMEIFAFFHNHEKIYCKPKKEVYNSVCSFINCNKKFSICKENKKEVSRRNFRPSMKIGSKIKRMRIQQELTLEELASRCELTKGFLSQLERDLTSPSIATLSDILEALGSSLSEFFTDSPEEQIVFRQADFFEDTRDSCTIRWIVPNTQKNQMEPVLVEIPTGGKSFSSGPHNGEEFGYVLTGSVVLVTDTASYPVCKGETFYLDGKSTHYIRNDKKQTAQVLWVCTPPLF